MRSKEKPAGWDRGGLWGEARPGRKLGSVPYFHIDAVWLVVDQELPLLRAALQRMEKRLQAE